jgi:hypothetical protein
MVIGKNAIGGGTGTNVEYYDSCMRLVIMA